MAQRVFKVCDLDFGKDIPATQTVQLSWGKKNVDLDVCDEHYTEMDGYFSTLLGAADNGNGKRKYTRRTSAGPRGDAVFGSKSAEVRAWAASVGIPVNAMGIVPKEIRNAYDEAMAKPRRGRPRKAV